MSESERLRKYGTLKPMTERRSLAPWAWLILALIIAVFTVLVIMVME